jgi:uncharacterized membrane protein (UPF0127 family)
MAAGPNLRQHGHSQLTRYIAAGALVVLVAAIVLATTPIGCRSSGPDQIATTTDEEVGRVLGARAEGGPEEVTIHGQTFTLDLAADNPTRMLGLGGRESIPENGGMLFVFPESRGLRFVMRDCPVPIDVMFLDPTGVVTAVHTMPPEEPQGPEETDFMYESRLAKYSSRFPAQFAIELKGGRIAELGVEPGDTIDLDLERLKRLAR